MASEVGVARLPQSGEMQVRYTRFAGTSPAMTEKEHAAFAANSLSFASARCAAGRAAMRAA